MIELYKEENLRNPLNGLSKFRISVASSQQREMIYRMRHSVYAKELSQHPKNSENRLHDPLDRFNTYIAAISNRIIVGFISITPPGHSSYSFDKYISRDELPFSVDETLYEVRLLTVNKNYRDHKIGSLLMYASLRWVEACGGKSIVVLGRREILNIYRKVGLKPLGRKIRAGSVHYELMSGSVNEVQAAVSYIPPMLDRLKVQIDWQLGIPYEKQVGCFHGGASFDEIGVEFNSLEKRKTIINADVLDAWFPPSPKVVDTLKDNLSWLVRTSPPVEGEGLVRTIAQTRGVAPQSVLTGAGSSSLIYLAFRRWLSKSSRVLILDPTYGEYAYIVEQHIGCKVDRLVLSHEDDYVPNLSYLKERLGQNYDLIIIVNPNNPTGTYIPREELCKVLKQVQSQTRIWMDETYLEYAPRNLSLEVFASESENVIVCKSMSKVYALSGLRVAYLCASPNIIKELKKITPPWAVSLVGQVAAVKALKDAEYYSKCYEKTRALRKQLALSLESIKNLKIVPSQTNYILCHLPPDGPNSALVVERCKAKGLFLRDAALMGSHIGEHAIRFAVKDAETNQKMMAIFTQITEKV